ncbi:NDMA-dependent alcohol dehydrogenase [Streptomyces sp. NPDC014892]|uniref:NDMA-dependent alcohol dehydrogenase n=1 Tax=Streptomyces sp. NPDC014892 TaxID=3364930 RepID=UPI0036F6E8C8
MKTKAAVVLGPQKPFEIVELDLDGPKAGEVLIRVEAAGLCHSDLHMQTGELAPRYPCVGGHEGAGVVEEVGPGVRKLKPGDHVVCSFIPSCGHCRYCATGRQNLCVLGASTTGALPDGTFRFHDGGTNFGGMCMLGTFSQYATVSEHSVVKVDSGIPLDVAVLVGCGVPTGWGSAVYAGDVRAGDTVVIYGIGGIGINAVQGSRYAGAKDVVVVDPVAAKRDTALELGATAAFADADEARAAIADLTRGQMADVAIVTVGASAVISAAFAAIGRGATMVVIGMGDPSKATVQLSGTLLTLQQKTVKGSLFGSVNPSYDIPRMLDLYQAGQLRLDELVTGRYSLDQINEGYRDLQDGKNIRGVIVHEH